jgi:hypothetical protein
MMTDWDRQPQADKRGTGEHIATTVLAEVQAGAHEARGEDATKDIRRPA